MDTTKLTGTALTRTCNMGFGHRLVEDVKEIENVLAHELVHNWASITGEQHLNSLYAEGTAEYYSNYISYKSEHNSLDEFVDVVNEKLKSFYSNPRCEEDYREAYDLSWTHSYA